MNPAQSVPVVSFSALQRFMLGRPITLGCAPCKMKERQEKANREFAERFGYVRDPRYPVQ
jgi:hypothetical protein